MNTTKNLATDSVSKERLDSVIANLTVTSFILSDEVDTLTKDRDRLKKIVDGGTGQITRMADELSQATTELNKATASLKIGGYTDEGGGLWKPPLGQKPAFELMLTNEEWALIEQFRTMAPGEFSISKKKP